MRSIVLIFAVLILSGCGNNKKLQEEIADQKQSIFRLQVEKKKIEQIVNTLDELNTDLQVENALLNQVFQSNHLVNKDSLSASLLRLDTLALWSQKIIKEKQGDYKFDSTAMSFLPELLGLYKIYGQAELINTIRQN